MPKPVISVEHLTKRYELGVIGTGTLTRDLERWWARVRGQPDPYTRIGQKDAFERAGETILALDDVSFTVEQGEALGIIGRNGAGKSTLLKILSRVTAPTSGVVKVKGRIGSLLEVGTGFHPELTGRENIYLNGAILGMKKAEVARKFDEIVDFSGVEKFIDTPVKRYSSGMYVRLAFAVAAHLDPEILVVDEVLAVGDAEFQKKCLGKMEDVAGEGRTVLFVSHNLNSIQYLTTRCIQLNQGELISSGAPKIVIDQYLDNIKLGGGVIRKKSKAIQKIEIKNFEELQKLSNSDDISINFSLAVQQPLRNVHIDLAILNNENQIIIHTRSSYVMKGLNINSSADKNINYKILKPNLAPGNYSINIYIYSDEEVLYWVENLPAINISSKVSFGNSNFIMDSQGMVLPKFNLEEIN